MKLVVEIIDARDLIPRDGEGSTSPYVEVEFDNQLIRTKTIPKNLNPIWDQKLLFNYNPATNYHHHFIEVSVYNERRPIPGRNFLGRARIPCANVVKKGEELYQCIPLEKKSFFSVVRGEIGLKIYISSHSSDPPSIIPDKTSSRVADDSIALIENKGRSIEISCSDHTEKVPENRSESTLQFQKHQVMQQQARPVLRKRSGGIIQPQANPQDRRSYDDDDFEVKEANPQWLDEGRGWMRGERAVAPLDLVEQTFYLYVRVVKAKDLPSSSVTGGCDPYVEVKLGNYKGRTRHVERRTSPEWNQVFSFSKERIQSSILEVFVKEKETAGRDEYLGRVVFDLNEIPTRIPPDSPMAPQWYRLEDRRSEGKLRGEIMVSVWMGTQADEAFTDAWHADAASVYGDGVLSIRSKVYVSPKLWYLRVNVIEAQDVVPNDRHRLPEVFVKAQLGQQILRTPISTTPTANPLWNEDLIFVAAEPFEENIVLTVEDQVHPSKDDVLGRLALPLTAIDKRLDHRPVQSRWFSLDKFGFGDNKFSSRIHLRICLEGGYHVLDESTMYISDQRPTAKQLWKPPVGILEIGILGAQGLLPMKMKDGRGSTDAYCVAKYGQKWVRTRTILDNFNPRWNEQYTWEVYDPCTVITLGVFDNCHLGNEKSGAGRDSRIGKVRIRLSTLEAHRVYTNSHPLLVLHPTGLKKMGEIRIAVRFTTLSLAQTISVYAQPLLPKMHYYHPFTVNQLDALRYQAMNIVAARLGRAEPPLRKEVVEWMLDVDSHMWSMRRSKANFFRVMSLVSSLISIDRWFRNVCEWKNPITSVLVHVLFLILVWYPELILPTMFLYAFLVGLWNYRLRPRHPPRMDTKLSWAEAANPDELDEEFDTFPTSKQQDIVRMRYDRLRSVAGRIQTVVGDVATQGERLHSVLSWRDPRATSLFVVFCLCAAVTLYATPVRVVILASGLYVLRHPKFRSKLPSAPGNFFKRLPAKTDSML
ncbi:FT-interacting protein 1-like [Andrographis paniculata]|uniref:FT-interacting protein 1-like n=1 Tax=Andrographis paniculata TaxID=175694 RepID=UPI0021E7DB1B|nr:FT-interacting protein 1-like [Andrographis paniculata]